MDASRTYTLDLRNVPILPVLHDLFNSAGKNFTVEPNVVDANAGSTVTVAVKDASFDRALATVAAAADPPLAVSVGPPASSGSVYSVYHVYLAYPMRPRIKPVSARVDAPDPADIAGRDDAAVASSPLRGAAPHLAATQAIQAARAFCRRIGQPVAGPAKAMYPAQAPAEWAPDFYWQPRWQVIFPGQATVQVVDATGVIASYEEGTPRHQVVRQGPASVVIKMTMAQSQAIRLAKKALGATGQPEGARFSFANISDLEYWNLSWVRAYHGIPYKNEYEGQFEQVNVWVNARTGRIESLRFHYPYPPLIRAVVTVKREQAIQIAQTHLSSDRRLQDSPVFEDAVLRVARPAIGVGGSGPPPDQPPPAYAVWIVRFQVSSPGSKPERDTWVDAGTGKIVADRSYRPPGHFGPVGLSKAADAGRTKMGGR